MHKRYFWNQRPQIYFHMHKRYSFISVFKNLFQTIYLEHSFIQLPNLLVNIFIPSHSIF